MKGDLHVHTEESDGEAALEEMAEAARAMGYEYVAITDHSKHIGITHGLDSRRLAGQMRRIDKLNGKLRGFEILKSAEVDILADGSLALPDSILKELDLVVASVHSSAARSRSVKNGASLQAGSSESFCSEIPASRASFQCMSMQYAQPLTWEARR